MARTILQAIIGVRSGSVSGLPTMRSQRMMAQKNVELPRSGLLARNNFRLTRNTLGTADA